MSIKHESTQLIMPGTRAQVPIKSNASSGTVSPGQEVLYTGNLTGGPQPGARGTVKRILGRKAVVDLGPSGAWHIPYFFLAVPVEIG